jgi:conjugative relaxase-like TrwC/TraI family protein
VLNIGRLAPGAADYYVGEVATSAEDYYTGRGESQGRWVGSLAADIGLEGPVEAEAFRAVLDGKHPLTGERLTRSRNGGGRRRVADPNQQALFDAELDIGRVATRLRLTVGRVRQLAWAGEEAQRGEKTPRFLVGRKVPRRDGRSPIWVFQRTEVERYEAEHSSRRARPGYDLTLRPPKSVSVLWALAGADERATIRQAHREAVDAVVDHLEQHAVYARRGTTDRGRIEVDGVIAAAFDHRTSRAGDPLLHTHVVTANLTRTAEGRWQAIDGRPLYTNARPAGFVYQAHLRHLLSARLGVEWEPVRNGWAEISGVPRAVIRAFSKRRDEIEEMVAEAGYTSAGAHQVATLATRRAKEYGVDADRLQERWRDEAAALGFGAAEVEQCFRRSPEAAPPLSDRLFDDLAGPQGLTRQASTFDRGDVVEAIAQRAGLSADAETVDRLADRFLGSRHAIALSADRSASEMVWRRNGRRTRSVDLARWSTPSLLALERRLLEQASVGFGRARPSPTERHVELALAAHPELSPEQVRMVRALCEPSAPAIQPIAGRPGSGKTHATVAAVDALTAAGIPVVGCSLSAAAAAELEDATDLLAKSGREASTVARLLRDTARAPLPPGTVVIVDEASMVGTRDLARIADEVERVGGAIKLIGDPDQHGAVESGGFFRLLCDSQGDALVRLVANNRQELDTDRDNIDRYREGLVANALAGYDSAGRVHRSATAAESYDALVADWWRTARDGSRDPMIAGPNVVRRALNHRARRLLRAQGVLTGEALVAGGREYLVGDWVVARRNDRSLASSSGHWVKNGSAGIVTGIDHESGALSIQFDREGALNVPAHYIEAGHLDHGYARTTYGIQGATLDRSLYHAGDEASFEEGYVALTRGRYETRIYLVDGTLSGRDADDSHRAHDMGSTGLSTVAAAMDRRRAKTLAHEADPLAATVAAQLTGCTLRDLQAERARLENVLRAAPRDVTPALQSTCEELDGVLTRSRSQQERLEQALRRAQSLNPLTRRAARSAAAAARQSLVRLDASAAKLREREASLRSLWRARSEWLEAHRSEAERLQVVLRAEHARSLDVRVAAQQDPPAAVLDLVGPAPDDLVARQAWRHAIGEAAVHLDRYGCLIPPTERGFEQWSFQKVAHATKGVAQTTALSSTPAAVATLELEL